MDRVPQQPVKDPPDLLRSGSFSLERLLSHIDPGAPEESEAFVHAIYEQRRIETEIEKEAPPVKSGQSDEADEGRPDGPAPNTIHLQE
jgi:hypothetical protein